MDDLVVLNIGKLTGQRYIDDILVNQNRLYAKASGDHFTLMDDKACPHRARLVQDYLVRESQLSAWTGQLAHLIHYSNKTYEK
jgi:hypothetical protein